MVVVSDLNKNTSGSTGLVKKGHRSMDLHTTIHIPSPPPPKVSNYIELAVQDYCIFLIYNPLNPAGPGILYFYVSVKRDVYSLYSILIFVAISYQGLNFFFPQKMFIAKNKIHAPKRKPMLDIRS